METSKLLDQMFEEIINQIKKEYEKTKIEIEEETNYYLKILSKLIKNKYEKRK